MADANKQSGWWPDLRRNGAWLIVWLTLTLGLLEPLACVLHCRFLMAQDAAGRLTTWCAYHPEPTVGQPGTAPAAPQPVTPRPYHELLLLAAALLLFWPRARATPLPPARRLTSWHCAPPTPVPIAQPGV